ncbi:nucleolin 1 isoform X3 [Hevea brasiliensis]|uniref:nucleolin 1 isoform X3 n=1 Tax=Hevea brasiliensis TaxID=3981 RepID=UPI0025EC439A|nr:nucleolin 1 isoform X3 [Hevea brasiliensis]
MGKSSKKSTPKVDAAPAVTPFLKSAKKGKREAEEAIEKLVSAKKQKIDEGVKHALKKEKVEVKTHKKKKEESSSSNDSSSEEELKAKVVSTKEQKARKPPVQESSSEESSSEEEAPPKATLLLKKQLTAAKNGSVGASGTKGKENSSSDSSDDESGDEELNVKGAAKKGVKATKPLVDESSSEDESSSDEPHAKVALPPKQQLDAKNGTVGARPKKSKDDTSSSESSDDESDEDEKKSSQASQVKKLPETVTKKASHTSSEESDSDSSSDEQTELPAKASAPQIVPQGTTKKNAEPSSSSDESESCDDSDSDEEKAASAKAPASKRVALPATNNKAQSSDDSDDSDSDKDKGTTTKAITAVLKVQTSEKSDGNGSSESDSDDSDSDSDSDASAAKAAVGSKRPSSVAQTKESKKVKIAQKESSSSEESSSDSSDDEEESEDDKPVKTPKKNGADVEMVDVATPQATAKKADLQSAKKAPKTPVTPEVQSMGSKTLFVGNLPFQVERADVESFFEGAGQIVDVRFAMDNDQRFKGFGHVEFSTAEAAQKALKLNGQSLNGRRLRLDLARERGERGSFAPYSGSRDNNSIHKGGRGQAQKIFVRGFDKSRGEDQIRSALGEHFEACGEVTRISIPTDYETGAIKGMAYLEFKDAEGFNKALELSGSQFGDQYLTVEEAKPPRSDNRDGWGSGSSGGRSSGGRSGGRDGGGRFGGRGGGRGRGRATPNKPRVTAAATGKKTTFQDDDE